MSSASDCADFALYSTLIDLSPTTGVDVGKGPVELRSPRIGRLSSETTRLELTLLAAGCVNSNGQCHPSPPLLFLAGADGLTVQISLITLRYRLCGQLPLHSRTCF